MLEEDLFLFQMVTARLVTSLGAWFHPEYYAALPIMLPHVVRDATARKSRGGEELWASPNEHGFVRDDNTLIKNLVKSLDIESRRASLHGKRLGKGWVASHIWQKRNDGAWASQHHLTNSFIPNLVWLPKALSMLSDRSESFVQRYLQATAYKIYSHVELPEPLSDIAASAWSALERPDVPESALPDPGDLNYFAPNESWVDRRRQALSRVLIGLEEAAQGRTPAKSDVGHTRYRDGLPKLPPAATQDLRMFLAKYQGAWA